MGVYFKSSKPDFWRLTFVFGLVASLGASLSWGTSGYDGVNSYSARAEGQRLIIPLRAGNQNFEPECRNFTSRVSGTFSGTRRNSATGYTECVFTCSSGFQPNANSRSCQSMTDHDIAMDEARGSATGVANRNPASANNSNRGANASTAPRGTVARGSEARDNAAMNDLGNAVDRAEGRSANDRTVAGSGSSTPRISRQNPRESIETNTSGLSGGSVGSVDGGERASNGNRPSDNGLGHRPVAETDRNNPFLTTDPSRRTQSGSGSQVAGNNTQGPSTGSSRGSGSSSSTNGGRVAGDRPSDNTTASTDANSGSTGGSRSSGRFLPDDTRTTGTAGGPPSGSSGSGNSGSSRSSNSRMSSNTDDGSPQFSSNGGRGSSDDGADRGRSNSSNTGNNNRRPASDDTDNTSAGGSNNRDSNDRDSGGGLNSSVSTRHGRTESSSSTSRSGSSYSSSTRNTGSGNSRGPRVAGSGDSCGEAGLIIAADEYVRNGGTDRDQFVLCMQGRSNTLSNCNTLRQRYDSVFRCDTTNTVTQTMQVTNQVLQTGATTSATIFGVNASQNTSNEYWRSQQGDSSADVQRRALEEAAVAKERTAGVSMATGGAQGVIASVLMQRGIAHSNTAAALQRAQQNAAASDGNVNIGNCQLASNRAEREDCEVRSNTFGLVGSAQRGAARGDADRERAEEAGANALTQARQEHNRVAAQTIAQSAAMMAMSANNVAQGGLMLRSAGDDRTALSRIQNPQRDPGNLVPFQGSDPTINPIAPPNIGGIQNPGATDEGHPEASPSPTPFAGGGDMLPPPSATGGDGRGGLSDTPPAPSALVSGVPNSTAAGGAAPSAGGGSGGDNASSEAREQGGESMANSAAQTANRFENMHGGYASSTGANRNRNDTGMDLNALLAQFLPKKDEGANAGNNASILDYGNGRSGSRGPAGQDANDDGSILGRNANLFLRVSQTMQNHYRRGDIR